MTHNRWLAGVTIAALTLLGFFVFPGHAFLWSDTQIYIPMLEHMRDPSLLAGDLVATRPHVSYTIYDEVTLLMARLGGGDLESALVAQQLLFRAVAILGIFLVGSALGLTTPMALLVSGVYALGATISGPAVLTVEYEPVPRGFALPFVLLAIGLASHGKLLGAGVAGAAGFLYHPPTVIPFWFLFGLWAVIGRGPDRRRRLAALLPAAGAALLLLVLAHWQPGVKEPQVLFGVIDPEWARLQQLRAPYNWISKWGSQWIQQYELLGIVSLLALLRLRGPAPPVLRWMLAGLPVYGLAMMFVSYRVLELGNWTLVPQLQPARAVLFITLLAATGAAAAGIHEIARERYWRGLAWFVFAYVVPAQPEALRVLLPDLRQELWERRAAVVLIAAGLAALAAWSESKRKRWALGAWAVALLAPFFLIPGFGKLVNFTAVESVALDELAGWARANTPKDAVFLFPEAEKGQAPGVFRARASRTVYVCWKAGGQVNFLRSSGLEWWDRWQNTMEGGFDPARLEHYTARGISHLVIGAKSGLGSRAPVYESETYRVYQLTGSPR